MTIIILISPSTRKSFRGTCHLYHHVAIITIVFVISRIIIIIMTMIIIMIITIIMMIVTLIVVVIRMIIAIVTVLFPVVVISRTATHMGWSCLRLSLQQQCILMRCPRYPEP